MDLKNFFINDIDNLDFLTSSEKKIAQNIARQFAFRTTKYYAELIKQNLNTPLRKIAIPFRDELIEWGSADPSAENLFTVMQGLEHKYDDTVLLLVSKTCFGYCRFCFRKRIFKSENTEFLADWDAAIKYISQNTKISNILLSGGDPLVLPAEKIKTILEKLFEIDHIKTIRIGTKVLAYNPFRIIDDRKLINILKNFSVPEKRIYIINDINHPHEITSEFYKATDLLLKAGLILVNQTPLLKGINDNPIVLANLFSTLSAAGIPSYYVFVNRPVIGNRAFAVEVEKGWFILEEAFKKLSGLEKRIKYVMSHKTGKIEIIAVTDDKTVFKYHRAAEKKNQGKILIFDRNPSAFWFDDYL